jgi:hypothetical protein
VGSFRLVLVAKLGVQYCRDRVKTATKLAEFGGARTMKLAFICNIFPEKATGWPNSGEVPKTISAVDNLWQRFWIGRPHLELGVASHEGRR